MKLAVIGSRSLVVKELEKYVSNDVTEIVSGGAKGADFCAKEFAISHKIKFTEFLPDYKRYGRAAPLYRNSEIIEYSDAVLAFWDGISKGTRYVIEECQKNGKR